MEHGVDACLVGVVDVESRPLSIMVGVFESEPSLKAVELCVLSFNTDLLDLSGC